MIITIDGPTASGKSTIAKMLARDLKRDYLYTGLLYRALAYILVNYYEYEHQELNNPSEEHLHEILESGDFVYNYRADTTPTVRYRNEDITPFLKTADVDNWSSLMSVNKRVRQHMVSYQRAYAQDKNIVVEGRDTGTVVFPSAEYKFFLTASPQERARRWQKDQARLGKNFDLEHSMQQVALRDNRDSTREISPLKIPAGALVIDSTDLDQAATLQKIKNYLRES